MIGSLIWAVIQIISSEKMATITFDKEVVERITQTRDLLEELLETIDVITDEELMLAIEEAEEEAKRGETRALKEFARELGLEDELRT